MILLEWERRAYEERQRYDLLGFSEAPVAIEAKHERGMAFSDETITEVNPSLWTIVSSSNDKEVYHIARMLDVCSQDHCFDKCGNPSCHGLCAHLFICSCKDKVPLCKHIHKLQSFILRDVPVSAFHEDSSDVNFFDMEDGIPETEPDDQRPEAFSDFSEANMYSRLQANVAALADHIFKKTIPKHLLPSCDTAISDIIKKCSTLNLQSSDLPMSMPTSRSIAPREQLATQLSQLLPFRRKAKRMRTDDDPQSRLQRLDRARKRLLGKDVVLVIRYLQRKSAHRAVVVSNSLI